MAIFSPFSGVNPSVIADSVCPIISATLSLPVIVVAFDRDASVFAFFDQNFPRFIGRVTTERLMRSLLVVDLSQQVQRGLQCDVVWNLAHPQHLLERGPNPLKPAAHPRAMRQRSLVTDTQPLQREGEDPGGEDCFIFVANSFWMEDIRAGMVDIVVVYKIDRMTRSLFDFAERIKVFEEYDTTFVSVTQQINTADAMERMVLHILHAFVQFECELTAERICDKFVSSKKKGLWMHGVCPLGCDVVDRRLVVNAAEAEQVRTIFHRFVELGSMLKVGQLHQLLRAPEMVEAMIPQAIALGPTLDEAQVTVAMTQVDRVWEQLFPAEQQRPVRLLVERVIVTPTNLELRLRTGGVGSLAADTRQVVEAVA